MDSFTDYVRYLVIITAIFTLIFGIGFGFNFLVSGDPSIFEILRQMAIANLKGCS